MTILLLIAAHALADFPLQGDYLSRAKNHRAPLPGTPWWIALAAHSAIHAGFVGIITGAWWLGVAEFVAHAAIDYAKCDNRIGYTTDQALHLACKVVWVLLLIGGAA